MKYYNTKISNTKIIINNQEKFKAKGIKIASAAYINPNAISIGEKLLLI